jgi:hypothetical protein
LPYSPLVVVVGLMIRCVAMETTTTPVRPTLLVITALYVWMAADPSKRSMSIGPNKSSQRILQAAATRVIASALPVPKSVVVLASKLVPIATQAFGVVSHPFANVVRWKASTCGKITKTPRSE